MASPSRTAVAVAPATADWIDDAVRSGGATLVEPSEACALVWTKADAPEALAAVLAANPQILVLDEPTSALDMRSEALVHQTLTDLQGSVTLVIIAHRLSTLKTCDRIMVFGGGLLQGFSERAELEANNDFYRDAIALSKLRS